MAKKIFRLTFPEELIQEPIVYRLGHEFQVVANIFRAAVAEKNSWIVLQLDGEEEEILRSIEFMRDMGVRVEERSASEF
ncbi:MAG: NIL domain-containing protein [Desulfatiglandales bacterium]|jgi:ABC-type methionine transport system ATPase subunit|nr:NIL domain-containing protein [Desulfatiglandales bacterium]